MFYFTDIMKTSLPQFDTRLLIQSIGCCLSTKILSYPKEPMFTNKDTNHRLLLCKLLRWRHASELGSNQVNIQMFIPLISRLGMLSGLAFIRTDFDGCLGVRTRQNGMYHTITGLLHLYLLVKL